MSDSSKHVDRFFAGVTVVVAGASVIAILWMGGGALAESLGVPASPGVSVATGLVAAIVVYVLGFAAERLYAMWGDDRSADAEGSR